MNPSDHTTWAPRDAAARALRSWWLVVLCVLVGAACGLLAHHLRPAEYESGFGVAVGIDLVSSGELTQYETDVAFEFAGQVLYKPAMRERVAAQARAEGMEIDAAWLRDHSTVERRLQLWRVRVRAPSPIQAERLAEIWLDLGLEELETARVHALIADGLRKRQQSLEDCLARAADAEPAQGLCVPQDLQQIQAQLAETAALIVAERTLSQGVSSAIVLGELPEKVEPARIVFYGRAEQAAAGGLLGSVIGVWAAQAGWMAPAGWTGKLARRRRG
jgi:hypothetical protein